MPRGPRAAKNKKRVSRYHQLTLLNIGRGERIRTFDPLVPNQMRYQAALRPDSQYSIRCWPLTL